MYNRLPTIKNIAEVKTEIVEMLKLLKDERFVIFHKSHTGVLVSREHYNSLLDRISELENALNAQGEGGPTKRSNLKSGDPSSCQNECRSEVYTSAVFQQLSH